MSAGGLFQMGGPATGERSSANCWQFKWCLHQANQCQQSEDRWHEQQLRDTPVRSHAEPWTLAQRSCSRRVPGRTARASWPVHLLHDRSVHGIQHLVGFTVFTSNVVRGSAGELALKVMEGAMEGVMERGGPRSSPWKQWLENIRDWSSKTYHGCKILAQD